MSKWMIILTVWLVGLCVLSSFDYCKGESGKHFFFCYILIGLALTFSFSVKSIISFYFGFESSLMVVYLVITGWGYQPERVSAGFYLFFYTLVGSFPLFCCVLWLMGSGGSMFMMMGSGFIGVLSIVFLLMGFLVKFPMYGAHIWLLKAHLEAPVSGSMILAGVLLKLGGYGLLRFSVVWEEFPLDFFVLWGVWGGFLMSIQCLRMMDIKLLVAASSVVHMGLCVSCVFYNSLVGMSGIVAMMVGHGLCSSGLFYLCGLSYSLYHSRSLYVCKGLISVMPSVSVWWFLLCSSNMSFPPSLNLFCEIMIICSLISWGWVLMFPVGLIGFFSAGYNLFLYSVSQHGGAGMSWSGSHSGDQVNHFVLMLHWVPLNMLFLVLFSFN